MDSPKVARRTVEVFVPFVAMEDENGHEVMVKQSMIDRATADGLDELVLRITLNPAKAAREKAGWLTVTAAATAHVTDNDGLTLDTARVRVSRAADANQFRTVGNGRDRRIDPVSFGAWRLTKREAALDEVDEDNAPVRGRDPRSRMFAHDDD